jgi:hypothetical protein
MVAEVHPSNHPRKKNRTCSFVLSLDWVPTTIHRIAQAITHPTVYVV